MYNSNWRLPSRLFRRSEDTFSMHLPGLAEVDREKTGKVDAIVAHLSRKSIRDLGHANSIYPTWWWLLLFREHSTRQTSLSRSRSKYSRAFREHESVASRDYFQKLRQKFGGLQARDGLLLMQCMKIGRILLAEDLKLRKTKSGPLKTHKVHQHPRNVER